MAARVTASVPTPMARLGRWVSPIRAATAVSWRCALQRHGEPEQGLGLADRDQHGGAGGEAHQDRPRREVDQHPQPGEREHDPTQAGQHRHGAGGDDELGGADGEQGREYRENQERAALVGPVDRWRDEPHSAPTMDATHAA